MTMSLVKSLKAGAPPPRVVLLPDALFFARAVPVGPGAHPDEVAAQVELALEALSPFPPAQLYHGYFWVRGAERVLVFAAYRRRFTSEQTADWGGAELVMPAFAAMLGADVGPATTLLLPSAEGLTAIAWDDGAVPVQVLFRSLAPGISEADRARVRDELAREVGSSRQVVELSAPPAAVSSRHERELVFSSGGTVSRLPAPAAAAIDVRDKADLAMLRRARARDLVLWRVFVGAAAALLLMALGELALVGAGLWQKTRANEATAQRPVVEKIMTAQSLATRIGELSTKRLLPFEMISLASAKKPPAIQFLRTRTDGLYTLLVEAQTGSPSEVSAYRSALGDQPATASVEVRDQQTRDNIMTFTLVITFRPEVLKPAVPTA